MKRQKKAEGSPEEEALKEKLRQIGYREVKAPETLKPDVFSSLDATEFLADVTGLFTVQFLKAELDVLDAFTSPAGYEEEE